MEKSKESLMQENLELRALLKDVVMYGESYKEWLDQYGTNQMSTQKQSFSRLVEKLKAAKKYLNS